jgi:glycerol-3-phosphate dehydrogenase
MLGITKTNNGTDVNICPRRGEYWVFPSENRCPVDHIIFPVPSQVSKGICLLPDPEGSTVIGPTSEELGRDRKGDMSTSREGLDKVYNYIAEKWGVPLPPKNRCVKNYAGLRAEPPHSDFIIEGYVKHPRFVNAIGIRSPGLTSSPAIAEEVEKIMVSQGFRGVRKAHWTPFRKAIPRLLKQPIKGRKALIRANQRYANLVCWCEGVSEGEIVEAIRRGARTIQGVAFRTRAGMGRCQGMSCQLKIVEILSKELGVPPDRILLKSEGSEVILCRIKDLEGASDG